MPPPCCRPPPPKPPEPAPQTSSRRPRGRSSPQGQIPLPVNFRLGPDRRNNRAHTDEADGFAALRRLPPATASMATLLTPVIGVGAATPILGEPLGARELLALGLTLAGT